MSANQITFLKERLAAIAVERFEVYVESCFTEEYYMTCILLRKQELLGLERSVLQATLDSLDENGSG
jgi:hypothetical protein